MKEIFEFDNIISDYHQNYLETLFFSQQFYWCYNNDPTFPGKRSSRGSTFSSLLLNKDLNFKSQFLDIVLPIAFSSFDKLKINNADVFNVRSFLHIKNESNLEDRRDLLHVDQNFPHFVILYYVNDSDGDTEITDKIFNESNENYEGKIIKSITPKRGKCVIFDGKYYHRSTHSKYSDRCIINFNFTKIC